MDIGTEKPAITVEPVRDPFEQRPETVPLIEREPEHEPEVPKEVPARG